MKALADTLQIGFGHRDADGTQLEPEEQPVDRILSAPLPVTLGNAPGEGTPMDVVMRGNVRAETTAGEVVELLGEACLYCAHWDSALYQRERPSYPIDDLNEQRAMILETATSEELASVPRERLDFADVILDASMGRCHALSHLSPDGKLDTHARACCPANDPSGNPLPKCFKARPEARRTIAGIRDRILRTAAGSKE